MKILEVCTFSAGGCGVFARVKRESLLLSKKGHNVQIFTTNREKGTSKKIASSDNIQGVPIQRFSSIKLGGESFTYWNFTQAAKEFNPDLIIVHSYRHTHTTQALKIAKQLNAKIFLVTHAPFNRQDTRTFYEDWIVKAYDSTIGKAKLRRFDKVLAISKWEIPYLEKLGLKKDDIVYSPNGIQEEFFKTPIKQGNNNILTYTGRIAPIKNLEVVIRALSLAKNKSLQFYILGPAEPTYKKKLLQLVNQLGLKKKIKIFDKRYSTKEQITHIDKGALFILSSLSEGMPQVLIEALARSRLVIASDIPASKDIIKNNINGFIFKKDNPEELAEILDSLTLSNNRKTLAKIKQRAAISVKKFDWNILIEKLNVLVNK